MNVLEKYQSRIKTKTSKSMLEIRIPLRKNSNVLIAMILATLVWIAGLYALVRVALYLSFFWYKAGLILAIVVWFAIGMMGASFFIWLFFGRERIVLNKEYFITDKPLVFFYRRNFYPISQIQNIRTDVEIYKANRNGNWVDESRTVIKFDTNNKLVTIARGIAKEEAEYILLQLAKSDYLQMEQFAVIQKL
ncbi:MAG TPA: hypothetical protein PK301_07695 [Chitinophagales bacterium]|mgnify:FL=1|nr:hypothetical protein [Chitinophagales bacterium]